MQAWQWSCLKWACLALSVASVLVAAGFMWLHADTEKLPDKVISQDDAGSTEVNQPLLVERKGKRIIWRLKAESAKQQENIMLLSNPTLELFTDNQEIIMVQGERAWFEPIKRNIHFTGDVKVDYRDWHLSSDDLRFDSTRDEVIVPNAFIITGQHTVIKGQGLRGNRKTQIVHIARHVWVRDSRPERLRGLQ